tara:strand:- start:1981 stop:2601 length:621 start_codon:yes stop_codon:yes gene_type:complete
MSWQKRVCDVVLACVLAVILAVPMMVILAVLLIRQGRPLFYVSERMKGPDQAFALWKLRTMAVATDDGQATGGHKAGLITPAGKWLRETRFDEVPQLWNILRGDMSFVGPRPPLRAYVERFPAVYDAVLQSRPGVTGLATLKFHQHEARLMAQCASAAESDRIYAQRCVPTKARLDLIYQRHQSIAFDLALMAGTVGVILGRKGNC